MDQMNRVVLGTLLLILAFLLSSSATDPSFSRALPATAASGGLAPDKSDDSLKTGLEDTAPSPQSSSPQRKTVLGYYTVYYSGDDRSYHSLVSYGDRLTELSAMTFAFTDQGTILGSSPQQGMAYAGSKQIKTLAAVSNQAHDAFDSALAHKIISEPSTRTRAIQNLLKLVQDGGYSGINIDFENMKAADRPYFTQFIQELATALHQHDALLVVSVMAKTADSPGKAWIGAFDYKGLGDAADQVQIMTYDEHDPWGGPGPVAGYPWVESVIRYAASQIPSSKILLGLAAYGYDWNTTTRQKTKTVLWKNVSSLLAKTGAASQWDPVEQSPFFSYDSDGNSHLVWFENGESLRAKLGLVGKYNLAGVSVWDLGFENDEFWNSVHSLING